jgi:hypothetical protein
VHSGSSAVDGLLADLFEIDVLAVDVGPERLPAHVLAISPLRLMPLPGDLADAAEAWPAFEASPVLDAGHFFIFLKLKYAPPRHRFRAGLAQLAAAGRCADDAMKSDDERHVGEDAAGSLVSPGSGEPSAQMRAF